MKSVLSIVSGILLTSVIASVSFADNSMLGQVVGKCKQEAVNEEVSAADMSGYMRQCLEDNGIEAADIDSVIQDVQPDNSEAQPSSDQG